MTDEVEQAAGKAADAMTKKKKPASKKKVTTKKKAVAKKATTKKTTAKKQRTDVVILKDLAKEAKLDPRVARVRLRAAEVPNEGRWEWTPGSSALKAARKALGLA